MSSTNLNGFYRGIVKAHSENGRCKVFWGGVSDPEWNKDENVNLIPDAEQAAPLFCASGLDNGVFFYPDIGSVVWGFFEDGDQNRPVYFASSLGFNANANTYNNQLKNDETSLLRKAKKIQIDGLTILINKDNKSISISNGAGNIVLSNDGGISLQSNKDVRIRGNNVVISAAKDIDLNSKDIAFTASENIKAHSQNNKIRTTGGGTSIIGDLPFFGIKVI